MKSVFKIFLFSGVALICFSARAAVTEEVNGKPTPVLVVEEEVVEEVVIAEIPTVEKAPKKRAGWVKQAQHHHQKHAKKNPQTAVEKMEKGYADFKINLQNKMGLEYSMDVSLLAQRGSPSGKGTSWQTIYTPSINWEMYDSKIGSGSLQFLYSAVRYWGIDGNVLGDRIGVITPQNDYTAKDNYFYQLSYTHTLPGKLSPISFTVGQFPIFNFDGTAYDSNQQTNFINEALSQNATDSYPTASLGGFVQIAPNSEWTIAMGMQDAHNIDGDKIETSTFGKHRYTSFASVSYTPTIEGWGTGEYSVLVYHQPSTNEQPTDSNGWSLNMMQNFGKVGLFGRINGVSKGESIKQSYVAGAVYNNPLGRNALDQIGVALVWNKLNQNINGEGTRGDEKIIEAYWAWGFTNFLTITPDIQFYYHPAGDRDEKTATVASLRANLVF